MLIKKSEYNDLIEEINSAKSEIKELKKENEKLQNSIKSDEIIVQYFEYSENPYRYCGQTQFINGTFQLNASIKLSSGIRSQILNLCRSIKYQFESKYSKKFQYIDELYKSKIEESNKRNNKLISDLKDLSKNTFISKKKLNNLINGY